MAGRYDFFNTGSGGRSFRDEDDEDDEDFEEDDVWSAVMDIKGSTSKVRKPKDTINTSSSVSSSPTVRRLPAAPKMIPRANNSSHAAKLMQQSSAPVNIPDWSKIYGKNPTKESDSHGYGYGGGFDGIVDDDDEDDDFIPPHEWVAKKVAMSQISSFSVCEGVGRTLKGRDLSKVRNAVLTRTGFLE